MMIIVRFSTMRRGIGDFDDFCKVFHNETGHPSTNAFVAPSVTTYTDNNPEYRIYEVDGTSTSHLSKSSIIMIM